MSYLDEFEKELRTRLGKSDEDGFEEWLEDTVKFVKAKVLESFKNGVETGRKRQGRQPNKKSRASK